MRQIARTTGIGIGPVQRELKQLTDCGIIQRRVQGRQVYYRANLDSPVFKELKSLITKSVLEFELAKLTESLNAIAPPEIILSHRFPVPESTLADFCRKHHIKKLALFGSVLREDFHPDSDIDVLVEFEPGHVPGFGIIDIENALSQIVGRKVDLHTPGDLSRYFRDQEVREAKVEYAASQP